MPGPSNQKNIAYQPLGLSPQHTMIDARPIDEEDESNDENLLFSSPLSRNQRSRIYRLGGSQTGLSLRNSWTSLRQLRALLFIVATLLFLTFLVQLTTNHNRPVKKSRTTLQKEESRRVAASIEPAVAASITQNKSRLDQIQFVRLKHLQHPNKINKHHVRTKPDNTERPPYYSYLTSVLRDHGSLSDQAADSDDDLSLPNDALMSSSDYNTHKHTAWWKLTFRLGDKYLVLENYIRAQKSFNGNSSITLTTQATTNFMYHTIELCKRWDGPISVAVFCPGIELPIALTLIKYMRQCLPDPLSACIRDKVTWHLVYNKKHGPPASAITFPRFHLDEVHYPLFIQTEQCPKLASGPNDFDLVKEFELELRKKNQLYPRSYREQFRLVYPINVLRNTARQTAQTKYVLASDIELYPSANLVPQFVNMIKNHNLKLEYPNVKKFVFALPIFEVKSHIATPPRTKQELKGLMKRGDAIFFHKWVCDECQSFPNRLSWLESDNLGNQHHHYHDRDEEELTIFEVIKRDKKREFWEPIFIGTKEDPEYDDRLSWDGRRDKMGQMYEMCLQGYHLFVLGNAFLVHAPGIKFLNNTDFNNRLDFIRQNNAIYDGTMAKLREQYKFSDEIKHC